MIIYNYYEIGQVVQEEKIFKFRECTLTSSYGEWRTCSTKLSRLTRVVTYRAVLGNK